MGIAIKKRLVMVSTPRSGHHAVANWMLRQHDGLRCMFTASSIQASPIQPAELAHASEHWWYEAGTRAHRDNQRAVGYLSGAQQGAPIELSVVMDCYERETLQEIQHYYRNCPATTIIVLRNIFNTIASMIKRRPQAPFFNMDVWKSIAREAAKGQESGRVIVLFDKWHADEEYRRLIARRLGVDFTDAGRDEILNIGRGSSFDQTDDFDNNARAMDVLNRYKGVIDHPTVVKKVLSDREALELNQAIFGNTIP